MTVKRKIVSLNVVMAAITMLIGSILIAKNWNKRNELKGFEKVSELLVSMIDLGNIWTSESQGVWDTSEEHTKQASATIGIDNYKAKIETTNEYITKLRSLVDNLEMDNHSPRFQDLMRNGLDFESRLTPIRSDIIDHGGEPWPATQEYVKQTKWLFGLIPQIATESKDPELVRKVIVSDLVLQLQLSMENHLGAINWALSTGNGTETIIANAQTKLADLPPIIERISMLIADTSIEKFNTSLRTKHFNAIIAGTERMIAMGVQSQDGHNPYPQELIFSVAEASQKMREAIPGFVNHIHDDIDAYTEDRISEANSEMLSSLAFIAAALLACTLGGWYIVRSIDRSIRSAVNELEESSESGQELSSFLSGAATDLANGCSEQAASIQEIQSTANNLKSLSKESVDQVTAVKTIATNSEQAARAGTESMAEMRGAMTRISDSSSEIANIAKEIEEIAFQTNILALNAAVEAARAGEAGAGFAIVADEVRNLAQKSAVSANSTREKINNSQESIVQGNSLSSEVDKHLQDILNQTSQFSTSMTQVEGISDQQRIAIGEVAKAISDIDRVTQQNAASAEESAGAAANLNGHAQNTLKQIYSLENFLVGTNNSSPNQTPASHSSAKRKENVKSKAMNRIEEEVLWN